jgi:hypothetical protein
MHVSEYFQLDRTQPSLDFVDVDIHGDLRLFVDPRALRLLPSEWGAECVALVQNYFRHVLAEIRAGNHVRARALLAALREPNEVHLGLSRGERSRGRALGGESARDVWESLRHSDAVRSGLLEDLEDSILMVPQISSDKVSDIAINLIREPLISYTQSQCALHGIPLTTDVDSGPLWNPVLHEWYSRFVDLPMTDQGRLLLVPKSIVRRRMTYDDDEYFRHYILAHLREVELNANSALVQLLKNGRRRVTNRGLIEKYGRGKGMVVAATLENPELLRRYRRDKSEAVRPLLSHDDLAHDEGTPEPDWDGLLTALAAVPLGASGAAAHERAIESLLTALFYPSLSHPDVQFRIHEGRKRIDIKYTNTDQAGFFWWVGQHYPAPQIFVECKNYAGEVGNPELDQLSSRFSPTRGKVGMLVCRQFDNKDLFVQRCRDTASDERGFVIPLDDSDLEELVNSVRGGVPHASRYGLLRARFERLIN